MKQKTKSKKKSGNSRKGNNQIEDYYQTLDLRTWWESFNGDCLENGNLKYKTIWQFIQAKTKVNWQRDFLYWILGPKGESDKYTQKQFDWETRRSQGHWFSSENAERLKNEVATQTNALGAMKEVGKVNLTFIGRIEALALEIDREYSGRLFLSNLSAKENHLRAQTYTMLLKQLQTMLGEAQLMYGKTQGMDLENLSSFFSMFSTGMSAAAAQMGFAGNNVIEGEVQNQASNTMHQIAQMIMAKSAERELDLPDKDMEGVVLEATRPKLVRR
jgi:hypothetical protein